MAAEMSLYSQLVKQVQNLPIFTVCGMKINMFEIVVNNVQRLKDEHVKPLFDEVAKARNTTSDKNEFPELLGGTHPSERTRTLPDCCRCCQFL